MYYLCIEESIKFSENFIKIFNQFYFNIIFFGYYVTLHVLKNLRFEANFRFELNFDRSC